MLRSSVSGAPSAISNRRVGGSLRPRFPLPSSPSTDVGREFRGAFALSLREARKRAFILLHTSLKCSQVRRGYRDPPRVTLTSSSKAASCSMTWNRNVYFFGN